MRFGKRPSKCRVFQETCCDLLCLVLKSLYAYPKILPKIAIFDIDPLKMILIFVTWLPCHYELRCSTTSRLNNESLSVLVHSTFTIFWIFISILNCKHKSGWPRYFTAALLFSLLYYHYILKFAQQHSIQHYRIYLLKTLFTSFIITTVQILTHLPVGSLRLLKLFGIG